MIIWLDPLTVINDYPRSGQTMDCVECGKQNLILQGLPGHRVGSTLYCCNALMSVDRTQGRCVQND